METELGICRCCDAECASDSTICDGCVMNPKKRKRPAYPGDPFFGAKPKVSRRLMLESDAQWFKRFAG